MKRILAFIILTLSFFTFNIIANDGSFNKKMQESLKMAIKLGDFELSGPGKECKFELPKFPHQKGEIPVLRFRMLSFMPKAGGCNYSVIINVSGNDLGPVTAANESRMVGKRPFFEMKSTYKGRAFAYWGRKNAEICLPFGPDFSIIDNDSIDGAATGFILDLSDVLSPVDGNSINFKNIRNFIKNIPLKVLVKDCEVGYINKSQLQTLASSQAKYEPLKLTRQRANFKLEVGQAGGFVYSCTNGPKLIVESHLSSNLYAPWTVLASDKKKTGALSVKNNDFGKYGIESKIRFSKDVLLTRRLVIGDNGLLQWREIYTNTSKNIVAVPYHHSFSFAVDNPRIWLSGEPEGSFVPTASSHPTIVLAEPKGRQRGMGITFENDMARLVSATKRVNDIAELYTTVLSLAPGKSIALEFSIDPIAKGGYWTFINALRKRWNLNSITATEPFFFDDISLYDIFRKNKKPIETMKKMLSSLGPLYVTLTPWRIGTWEIVNHKDKYAKLPKNAPRALGKTSDLDIDEFLKFGAHDVTDNEQKILISLIHKNLPNVKLVQMNHASMEAVYLPYADRWPYADCAIKDVNGKIFHNEHYDMKLDIFRKKDWVIGYYVPYGGSAYYNFKLEMTKRALDIGFDGIYVDEFSFAFPIAGYSRYNYASWDGFSADIGPNNTILHLKSDNAYTSIEYQNALVNLVKSRGKFFLGNGMAATRSVNNAPCLRFWEDFGRIGWAHIAKVPLILGHMKGESQKLVFEGVRYAISEGCIYSPLLSSAKYLKGKDNFISKQYPITVIKLMQGGIVGKERILTTNSGSFDWPGVPDKTQVILYTYDENGNHINIGSKAIVNKGKISIKVPHKGLVIAELPKGVQAHE